MSDRSSCVNANPSISKLFESYSCSLPSFKFKVRNSDIDHSYRSADNMSVSKQSSKLVRSVSFEPYFNSVHPFLSYSNPSMEFDLMFTSNYEDPLHEDEPQPLTSTYSIESFGNISHISDSLHLYVFSKCKNKLFKFSDALGLKILDPHCIRLSFQLDNLSFTKLSLFDAIEEDLFDITRGLLFLPNGTNVLLINMISNGSIEGLDENIEFRMLPASFSMVDNIIFQPDLKTDLELISSPHTLSFLLSNHVNVETVWDNMIGEGVLKVNIACPCCNAIRFACVVHVASCWHPCSVCASCCAD